jgi:hypothetical protein
MIYYADIAGAIGYEACDAAGDTAAAARAPQRRPAPCRPARLDGVVTRAEQEYLDAREQQTDGICPRSWPDA